VHGHISDVPIMLRVEGDGQREWTVAVAALPPLDIIIRLATPDDLPDDPARRWLSELYVTGSDADAMTLLAPVEQAQLLREVSSGLDVGIGNIRFAWPGSAHNTEALRTGLIAGPVWVATWLRGFAASPSRKLGETASTADEPERRATAMAALHMRDPRHPRLHDVVDKLLRSDHTMAHLLATWVAGDDARTLAALDSTELPSPWRRWLIEQLLEHHDPGVRRHACRIAAAHQGPALLGRLVDDDQLGHADFLTLVERWRTLDATVWDTPMAHRVLHGTVQALSDAGTLREALVSLTACPVFVRREVAIATGRAGDITALERIAPLRHDPDPSVVAAALAALGNMGLDEAKLASLRDGAPSRVQPLEEEAPVSMVALADDEDDAPTVEAWSPTTSEATSSHEAVEAPQDTHDETPSSEVDDTPGDVSGDDIDRDPLHLLPVVDEEEGWDERAPQRHEEDRDDHTENTAVPMELAHLDLDDSDEIERSDDPEDTPSDNTPRTPDHAPEPDPAEAPEAADEPAIDATKPRKRRKRRLLSRRS
jgi:hypothetical protein